MILDDQLNRLLVDYHNPHPLKAFAPLREVLRLFSCFLIPGRIGTAVGEIEVFSKDVGGVISQIKAVGISVAVVLAEVVRQLKVVVEVKALIDRIGERAVVVRCVFTCVHEVEVMHKVRL